jgi:hypothetical protein
MSAPVRRQTTSACSSSRPADRVAETLLRLGPWSILLLLYGLSSLQLLAADGDAAGRRLKAKDHITDAQMQCDTRSLNGQLWGRLKCAAIDCMWIANEALYDEATHSVRLKGDALVKVKETPGLSIGELIAIDLRTGSINVRVGRPAAKNEPTSAGDGLRKDEKTRADGLWNTYKVEFLVRTMSRIDVATICDAEGPTGSLIINGMSLHRVLTCRSLLKGRNETRDQLQGVCLIPPTDATKVFVVDFRGEERRNWIPYDKALEERIVALKRQRNIR